MKTSTFYTVLAAFAAVATATLQPGGEEDTTTTMTSTMTLTYTLTECAPDVPDCPANSPQPTTETEPEPTSEMETEPTVKPTTEPETEPEPEPTTPSSSPSVYIPVKNTTSAGPTTLSSKSPTLITQTSVVDAPTPSSSVPTVPESGSDKVFLHSGLVMGAVFVAMVALA